jgi:hypothetical protein
LLSAALRSSRISQMKLIPAQSNFLSEAALSKLEWPISGRFSVRSDSFHRQNVQYSADNFSKRVLYAGFSFPLIGRRLYWDQLHLRFPVDQVGSSFPGDNSQS